MPMIVQRVSNAHAQGTRWRATPNAHQRKDQTVKISEKKEERTSPEWLIFTAVNWLSFIALQTPASMRDNAALKDLLGRTAEACGAKAALRRLMERHGLSQRRA